MRTLRPPKSVRGLMLLVLAISLPLSAWAGIRHHVHRRKARRAEMVRQADSIHTLFHWLDAGLPDPGPASSYVTNSTIETREWSAELTIFGWQGRAEEGPPVVRMSGGNGEFSLAPIAVEILDPSRDGPWLARLLSAYEAEGWRYRVVRPAATP